MQSGKHVLAPLFHWFMNICNYLSVVCNEVKCAIIKIQKINAADDYDRTLNCK